MIISKNSSLIKEGSVNYIQRGSVNHVQKGQLIISRRVNKSYSGGSVNHAADPFAKVKDIHEVGVFFADFMASSISSKA